MFKFEATFIDASRRYQRQDFDTAQEAVAAVEAVGSGNVTKFREVPNGPGCLPKFVSQSCALWRYERDVWSEISIFGGYAESLGEGKPA